MKLYHVIRQKSETMFVSNTKGDSLKIEAESFLAEENKYKKNLLTIIEVTDPDQIPEDWRKGNLVWGMEEEVTPSDFLKERNPEYKEYLRLKEKFG